MKNYNINEVAKMFNITTNKIRFYEEKGLISPKRNSQNEYRQYNVNDIMRLQSIILYRSIGMSIDNIRDMLNDSAKHNLLNHFTMQWELVNNQIDKLNDIRKSIGDIIDIIYENTNADIEKEIFNVIKSTNELNKIKNQWKDKWNFNGWAEEYDTFVHHDKSALNMYKNYEFILDTVFNKASEEIDSSKEILEIGVGTGNLAQRFLNKGYDIIGIDQSRSMMDKAKEKYPSLKVRVGQFLKIPFSDNKFDIIVSTYAFHHLNDEEKVIAIDEMLRVLKDNGMIVMGDLMFESSEERANIEDTLSKEQVEEVEDEYFSNIEYLEEVLKERGKNLKKTRIDMVNWIIEIR